MKPKNQRSQTKKANSFLRSLHRPLLFVLIAVCCIIWMTPLYAFAEVGSLEIRVGYFGDVHDYRTKATLTYAQLDALCDEIYEYHNVTNVGTVMGTIAQGVPVVELLEAAGLDPDSVRTLNFRTTDGTQVNQWFVSLGMDQWVNQTRYYYPNLRADYDNSTGEVVPLSGALNGKIQVPSILAIRSFSTKSPTAELTPDLMTEEDSYRFCCGQGPIFVGQPITEVTSMNSAKWVIGVDVTLWGSPSDATSLKLTLTDTEVTIGSTVVITATILGQDLFEEQLDGTILWSSSDEEIATVDSNGVVTIHKAGEVTITATTSNGISKSVTINGIQGDTQEENTDNGETTEEKTSEETTILNSDDHSSDVPSNPLLGVKMKEITWAGVNGEDDTVTPLPAEERDPSALGTAIAFGGACLALGMIWRITGYRKEV